jgi:hypothetical protein
MSRVLAVFLLLVSVSANAATIPGWETEFELAPHRGPRAVNPRVNGQQIASDGERVLVVNELSGVPTYFVATLLDAGGAVLRETRLDGVRFAPTALVWSGRYFVILASGNIIRLTRDGAIVDTKPAPTSGSEHASNGRRTLFVSQSAAWFLDAEADGFHPVQAPVPSNAREVSIASAGNTFGFLYHTTAGTPTVTTHHFALIDENGTTLIADRILSTLHSNAGELRSDGRTYAVFLSGGPSNVRLLSPDGTVIRENAISPETVIRTSAAIVAVPGRGYLFHESGGPVLYLDETNAVTRVHDEEGPFLRGAVTTSKTSMLLPGGNGVVLFKTPAELKVEYLNRKPLLYTDSDQRSTAAVTNALGTTLVAWLEQPPDIRMPVEIRALRLDARGAPLDRQPLLVGTACNSSEIAVETEGSDFLVAWNWCGAVSAARVSANGTVLDPVPHRPGLRNGGTPSVAFDGIQYALLWETGTTPLASRITPGGTLLDFPPRTAGDPVGSASETFLSAAPAGGFLLGRLESSTGDLRVFVTQRLDVGLQAVAREVQVTAPGGISQGKLTRHGDGFLLTYLAASPAATGIGVEWLDANGGRPRTTGPPFPIVVPNGTDAVPRCDRTSCIVLATRREIVDFLTTLRRITATDVGRDQQSAATIGAERLLAGPTPSLLRPAFLAGTVAAPKFLIYERSEYESGNAVRLFIRRVATRERAVRK